MFRKFIVSILVVSMALTFFIMPKASAINADSVSAPSAILVEPSSFKILYEKNSHEKRACASITKIMTVLLVLEEIDKGTIKLTDDVVTSEHASSMGGSDIWLEVGEIMTVDEMLEATLVASANDAAVALAELVAGSEDDFVTKMNDKAKELGMKDTIFKNCNGLDEDGHITSAYDVAIMSSELIKEEKVFDYTTIWLDTLRGGETQIVNTNKLLKSYDGMKGLKTGTTGDAGSCISAYAQRNSLGLIAVVLGCDSGQQRFKDAAALLDYGFANYVLKEINLPNKIPNVKVKSGMRDNVKVKAKMDSSVMLPKGSGELTYDVSIKSYVTAPVNKGDVVGKVVVKSSDETIGKYEITAQNSVAKTSFIGLLSFLYNLTISL